MMLRGLAGVGSYGDWLSVAARRLVDPKARASPRGPEPRSTSHAVDLTSYNSSKYSGGNTRLMLRRAYGPRTRTELRKTNARCAHR